MNKKYIFLDLRPYILLFSLRLNNKLLVLVQITLITVKIVVIMKFNQRQLEAPKREIISVNNRYSIIKQLGDGLTSTVFLCLDTAT